MGNDYKGQAAREHQKLAAEKLRVSFQFLELDQHFFLTGLIEEHYKKIFDCLNTIANATENEIRTQTHPSLEPKSIFNTKSGTYKGFPSTIAPKIADMIAGKELNETPGLSLVEKTNIKQNAEKQSKLTVDVAFEVRIGKSYGRIHGFLWDKVFYVVWFDPAHNLYPDDRYGGVKIAKEFARVKCFGPDSLDEVRKENDTAIKDFNELKQKYDALESEYLRLLDETTTP